MSLRVFRVARRTHDLYFLQDRAAITCCGGELREAAKKEAATGMVGKASTGSDTRLVNLPWQINEDVYKPEREYRERRQKHFRFRPVIDQSATLSSFGGYDFADRPKLLQNTGETQ